MKIVIKTIPHEKQRYDTCGDWFFRRGTLQIRVSETGDEKENFLVALHEITEAMMCKWSGVSEKEVTAFDVAFEKKRPVGDNSEPGGDPSAPYFAEHAVATEIELLAADRIGVDWMRYSRDLEAL